MILVGVRANHPGRWSVLDFRLRYRMGDHSYEASYGQGLKIRVVPTMRGAQSSAAFSSFRTETGNVVCAYLEDARLLRCYRRSGPCYETSVGGRPQRCSRTPPPAAAHVVRARDSWLYHGFRCYAGHSSVRCRNQVFEGFFLSSTRSHHT